MFEFNSNGFPFRGADQNGQCYFVADAPFQKDDRSIYQPPEYLINDLSEKLYFDDPVFTFEDDMMFGCTLSMDYAELEKFCQQKGWTNLVILQ